MNKQRGIRGKICSIVLYTFFLVLMTGVIENKENYHVDEIYSYGLANNTSGIQITFEDGVKYSRQELPYIAYMSVSEGERYNYANVWKNQANDVHPPLYYALLHTICSVFPGSIRVWYAGAVNIIFALLTLYILRKLLRLLWKMDYLVADILSFAFVISPGVLSSVSFLRMYMMAMFWVTLLTYVLIKEAEQTRHTVNFFIKLFITAVLGALTHYYCIVFTVLICGVYWIMLLCRRRWKEAAGMAATGILAGGASCLIFPAMLKHIFSGYRGTQSMDNLKITSFTEIGNRLKNYFSIIDRQVFGGILPYVFAAFLFAFIFFLSEKEHGGKEKRLTAEKNRRFNETLQKAARDQYILILIPAIFYFLIVAKIAVYITDRYMFPVYGILLIGIGCVLGRTAQRCFGRKNAVLALILCFAIISVNGWKEIGWPYLYKSSESLLEKTAKYSNTDCVYIYDAAWKTNPSLSYLATTSRNPCLHFTEKSNGYWKRRRMNTSLCLLTMARLMGRCLF